MFQRDAAALLSCSSKLTIDGAATDLVEQFGLHVLTVYLIRDYKKKH